MTDIRIQSKDKAKRQQWQPPSSMGQLRGLHEVGYNFNSLLTQSHSLYCALTLNSNSSQISCVFSK
jgi:hypothetical protein